MSISAHTFADVTRKVKPSVVAYYMAHAYMARSERIGYAWVKTEKDRRKKALTMGFLAEIAKKFIRLSDDLARLEKEFSKKDG